MSNYEISSMIHNVAMEAADFANLARMRGNQEEHQKQLQLAFILDKAAALRLQSEPDENEWKFLFLSSAGWLAYKLELYVEAAQLVELGLKGKSDGIALYRLQELQTAVKEKMGEDYKLKKDTISNPNLLYGMLASADVEQEEVKIKENGKPKYRIIKASKEMIQTVARYLIGEFVEINALVNKDGGLILKEMHRAI